MSDLLIEKKHMDMMKYAVNKINQLPKKERVLADMMRDRMYRAWELIGQQQWRKDRLPILKELDICVNSLKRLVRLANDMNLFQGSPDEEGRTKTYHMWSAMLVEEGKIIGGMMNPCRKS
ncbi:MAG: four helix bundle protein [Synergistaceae bacterium]|nr:four helix bundle protein [Synergistaceae bacterium]